MTFQGLCLPSYQQSRLADLSEKYESSGERNTCDDQKCFKHPKKEGNLYVYIDKSVSEHRNSRIHFQQSLCVHR